MRRLYASLTYRLVPSQAIDMGVRSESAASEAWFTEPPIWPMMKSANGAFWVGIVLNTMTRSLPPSATNSRLPVDSAKRGKLTVALQNNGNVGLLLVSTPFEMGQRTAVSLSVVSPATVEKALLGTALTISGCPITT